MIAAILKFILPSLEDGLLKAIFGFIGQLLENRGLISLGATQQALGQAATEIKVEQSMAQAAANAPTNKADALQRLKDGSA